MKSYSVFIYYTKTRYSYIAFQFLINNFVLSLLANEIYKKRSPVETQQYTQHKYNMKQLTKCFAQRTTGFSITNCPCYNF